MKICKNTTFTSLLIYQLYDEMDVVRFMMGSDKTLCPQHRRDLI